MYSHRTADGRVGSRAHPGMRLAREDNVIFFRVEYYSIIIFIELII